MLTPQTLALGLGFGTENKPAQDGFSGASLCGITFLVGTSTLNGYLYLVNQWPSLRMVCMTQGALAAGASLTTCACGLAHAPLTATTCDMCDGGKGSLMAMSVFCDVRFLSCLAEVLKNQTAHVCRTCKSGHVSVGGSCLSWGRNDYNTIHDRVYHSSCVQCQAVSQADALLAYAVSRFLSSQGTFSGPPLATVCLPCGGGLASLPGAQACGLCPVGYYIATGGLCVPCALG